MRTPFGVLPAFDAHLHFFGRTFFAGLAKASGRADEGEVAAALGWDPPTGAPRDLAARWAAELGRHGVAGSVLFHTLPGALAEVLEAASEFPLTFLPFAMANPLDPACLDGLRGAAGLRGVCLFPAMHRFSAAGPEARAVFEIARERRWIVFVHCGVLKVPFRAKLGMDSAFSGELANPLALQQAAAEFRDVPFIVPHLGSGFLRELLMLADQCPNVHADTSGIQTWARHLEMGGDPAQALRRVLDVLGPNRILFGSDSSFFPRGFRRDVVDRQMEAFRAAGIGAGDASKILGGNLRRIAGVA